MRCSAQHLLQGTGDISKGAVEIRAGRSVRACQRAALRGDDDLQ